MGMERVKQKLFDDWGWRPSDPPGYLEEYVSIGELSGYYRIYVEESPSDPDTLEISVESVIP